MKYMQVCGESNVENHYLLHTCTLPVLMVWHAAHHSMDRLPGLFPEPQAVLYLVPHPTKGERGVGREAERVLQEVNLTRLSSLNILARVRKSITHVGYMYSKAVHTLAANQCQVLEILQHGWLQEWAAG